MSTVPERPFRGIHMTSPWNLSLKNCPLNTLQRNHKISFRKNYVWSVIIIGEKKSSFLLKGRFYLFFMSTKTWSHFLLIIQYKKVSFQSTKVLIIENVRSTYLKIFLCHPVQPVLECVYVWIAPDYYSMVERPMALRQSCGSGLILTGSGFNTPKKNPDPHLDPNLI